MMKKLKQRGHTYLYVLTGVPPHFTRDILGVGFIVAVTTVSLICLATSAWVATL